MATLPFDATNYLADTLHLSTEEHGAYFLIILHYWQTKKPIQETYLPSITKLNGKWTTVSKKLEPFFQITNGEWKHNRIEQDLFAAKTKSAKASKAGKMSAAAKREKTVKDATPNQSITIRLLFKYWQDIHDHKTAKMDIKRRAAIAKRLIDGYTEQDIKDAIDGCKLSEFHQGKNDRRIKYDDIELICRNAGNIDKFIAMKKQGKVQPMGHQKANSLKKEL